jgi:WD repeat and SOF domain-containing protein 1
MDHTAAVVDVDYSPTGRELVSGSYDKTVRIWSTDSGRSREVYHTKRMQRLTGVAWSLDNKYVVSASDEMCLRVWKARASEKLGVMRDRERVALQYNEKLKEKYGQHPKVSCRLSPVDQCTHNSLPRFRGSSGTGRSRGT